MLLIHCVWQYIGMLLKLAGRKVSALKSSAGQNSWGNGKYPFLLNQPCVCALGRSVCAFVYLQTSEAVTAYAIVQQSSNDMLSYHVNRLPRIHRVTKLGLPAWFWFWWGFFRGIFL